MSVVVITPPTRPVGLRTQEVKAFLNVEHEDDDALLEALAEGACAHVQGPWGVSDRCFWPQTLELRQDGLCGSVRLPFGPVTSVVSLIYVDAAGQEITLAPSTYQLSGDDLVLAYGMSWPGLRGDADGVRIRYVAGFATPPAAITPAVLQLIGHWYANRESVVIGATANEIPLATQALLAPFRKMHV